MYRYNAAALSGERWRLSQASRGSAGIHILISHLSLFSESTYIVSTCPQNGFMYMPNNFCFLHIDTFKEIKKTGYHS